MLQCLLYVSINGELSVKEILKVFDMVQMLARRIEGEHCLPQSRNIVLRQLVIDRDERHTLAQMEMFNHWDPSVMMPHSCVCSLARVKEFDRMHQIRSHHIWIVVFASLALSQACSGTGMHWRDAATFQQTTLLLASLLQSLSGPSAMEGDSERLGTQSHWENLAKDRQLAERFETSETVSVVHAIAQLAWGLLLDLHAPATYRGQSQLGLVTR